MPMQAKGYSAQSATAQLQPCSLERRDPRPQDVVIEVLFCGVCHSDIHTARNEWGGGTHYPVVPGHEIIGRVSQVGDSVTKYKKGDLVGVGCMVDSCHSCSECQDDLEQYCNTQSFTYNSKDKIGGSKELFTLGGYSNTITVDEHFVLRIPSNLDLAASAPLLCAGITTYSPLKHWKVKAGQKVGIIGLGGLGHMGVKFAHAMGAKVVMITTSPEKGEDAKKLGADEVLLSTDASAMQAMQNSFDFLLNTIPVGHNVDPYMALLKRDATMVVVGAIEPLKPVNTGLFVMRRRQMAGSLIGGLAETQEMLDFCGEHNITCDIEKISMEEINQAYDRTVKGNVKYRFVIDMASL